MSALRSARLSKGLTQEVLAERAGLSGPQLSRIESGAATSTRTVRSLVRALGLEGPAAIRLAGSIVVGDVMQEGSGAGDDQNVVTDGVPVTSVATGVTRQDSGEAA